MKRSVSTFVVLAVAAGFAGAMPQAGHVVDFQKVSDLFGNFTGGLNDRDYFGSGIQPLGDVDGDGVVDLVVGMPGGDRGGLNSGAIWIVFMNPDGTVKDQLRINDGRGGFDGELDYTDNFGASVACLGDMDGDGVNDLAVGTPSDDGGPLVCSLVLSCNFGGYWILFMNPDGTVRDETEVNISHNFGGGLSNFYELGSSLAGIGDLNGDGVPDLAAGMPGYAGDTGSIWIILQQSNGLPGLKLLTAQGTNGFGGSLSSGGRFGAALASLGDMDGDGVVDLAVGANLDADGGAGRGAVWILFLNADGTIKAEQKISDTQGGFDGVLHNGDRFGSSVAAVGDLDGDGVCDLAVGADLTDDGGLNAGALWILFMNSDGTVRDELKISEGNGGLNTNIRSDELFGAAVAPIGDLNGDGLLDVVVGAPHVNDGATENGDNRGAFYVLFLDGLANLDFERDGMEPLANGMQVGGGTAVLSGVSIEGFPHSGLTAAVFDSDPTGPNALSTDPDLLVDTGNVLILQEVPGQSTPGIYDVPDDDRFGGSFVLTFGGLEVVPLSLDLIDICPAPGQTAYVTLLDASGLTRTYTVPNGWTEDIAANGPPGFRTLDLTTLGDQAGYQSTATAAEDVGFDPVAVVLIDVFLTGSGAIDNLRFDPYPDPAPEILGRPDMGATSIPRGVGGRAPGR